MPQAPRTVLHGVDQSAPTFAKLPEAANMAAQCFQEDNLSKWIYDGVGKEWLPVEYIAARWNFTNDGGNVGFIDLNVQVPAGTIVLDGLYQVLDALVGAGASILLKLEAAAGAVGDIIDTEAIGTAGTLGLHDIDADGTVANAIVVTSDKYIKMEVTGAALTRGELVVFLRCLRGFLPTDVSSSSSSSESSSSQSSSSSSSQSSSSSSSQSSSSSSSTSSTSSVNSSSSLSSPSSSQEFDSWSSSSTSSTSSASSSTSSTSSTSSASSSTSSSSTSSSSQSSSTSSQSSNEPA